MDIRFNLIPKLTKRRSGKLIDKTLFFVDHDTGNPNSTAQNNVDYFIRTCDEAHPSAHIFIDDKEAIMCIPCFGDTEKAWHVLYNVTSDNMQYGDDANDVAIGLELCYFPDDYSRTLKAYNNYIEVAIDLAKFHEVDPMKRSGHFELDPTRKTDPNNALKIIGKTYDEMKGDIMIKFNEELQEKKVSEWAKEAWQWAIDEKINDGVGSKNEVTEEQLMVFLKRYHDRFDK